MPKTIPITRCGCAIDRQCAKILKMCILEARILKSATADAEHVLLAILKDGDNLAATVLEENRVNYQAVFEQLTMQSTNECWYGISGRRGRRR